MPNHVYMNMHINGTDQEVANFFEKHLDDDDHFDFETFKKMPDELRGTKAPCEPNPELVAKYGYDNWYDWHINNWGTKWNSYDNEIQDNVLSFQTAWSMPEPIFKMMAEMYPTMTFEVEVVEEGGYYAGRMFIAEGKVKEDLSSDMNQWRAYAAEFLGWDFDADDE